MLRPNVALSGSVTVSEPNSLTLRTATDDDWPGMTLLGETSFGSMMNADSHAAWRTLMPSDSAVIMCDGDDVVGQALYLDMQLTVPGGAALPVAGISFVGVAPTHRRRGILRAMYTKLHRRIADAGYPIAALTASEGGIYGRFGYGPATIEEGISIDRRFAHFRADAPDPGGVRLVKPAQHRDDFAAIYERWRQRTPGGLAFPTPLWDDLLADREDTRDGGSAWFGLLHPDGYALYRVHDDNQVRVGELIAATSAGEIALWRALLGLDLMEKVSTTTYPGNALPCLLTDPRLVRTTSRADDLWLRLMDIPTALQARRYAADIDVVLDVSDGFRADGGRFALTIRDGQAHCAPTDAEADVQLSLDVLGSLYLGAHRTRPLAIANRLRAKNSDVVTGLDAAFASEVPAQLGYSF